MSPHPCSMCLLFEARGVCPMARDAYGLETPALAQRRAEALRAGIAQDAPAHSLPELMRRDAQRQRPGVLLSPAPLALPAASAAPLSTDSRKEAVHAATPRTTG